MMTFPVIVDGCDDDAIDIALSIKSNTTWSSTTEHGKGGFGGDNEPARDELPPFTATWEAGDKGGVDMRDPIFIKSNRKMKPGYVDLYINVRVTNGHPESLDTILRVRFTVAYVLHEPSALHTWNTRASTAAAGVIQSGVVGDAPEGGKKQHEDTTVVVA
jgi:hypothetical protein